MRNNITISRIMHPNCRQRMLGRLFPILAAAALLVNGAPAHAYSRGVNMAGLEFGGGTLPGTLNSTYTENSEASYNYFGNKGLTLIRVPFLWERVQPTLNGPLDAAYLGYITQNITWAKLHGCKVMLDVHNYGAYRNGGIDVGGSGVTSANLADLWTKLSTQYKNEAGVYAYDIMNEPANAANWHGASQAVVTAIRNNGDNKLIYVPGSAWESAGSYSSDNGPTKWITDPANNIKYSAHLYFDHDNSGTYGWTYDQELAANSNLAQIGVQRLDVFKNWCVSNGVSGLVGEFAVPGGDSRWFTPLNNFYNDLDAAGFDGTYFAGGEWWGTTPIAVQPSNNFTVDAPQMPTLLAHLGGGGGTAPSPPANLTGTSGNTQIALSWSASSGATSYNVKRGTVSGSGYATVSSPATTSYTDTGLTNGSTYYYLATAVNSVGESANSNQASGTPASGGTSGLVKINCGGPAASPFAADTDFSGGTTATNWTGVVDTSAAASPAPQAVYQSERWGNSTYTVGGLTANASYTVRLHFCENYWTAAGARTFNVSINSTQVLTNFDIYATAGAIHKANIQQFSINANGSGQFVIATTTVVNNALINGIEVNTAGTMPPAAPTSLSATAGNTQVALSWAASSGATSYNILRSTVNGSGYTSVATGITVTNYTNAGLTNGTTYYFVVTAVNASGTSGNSNQASATPAAGGGGGGNITSVRFYPRSGLASRMTGGKFQGSNDNANWTDLFTIAAQPTDNAWSTGTVSTSITWRYLRYLSPNAGYGNVAEIEFYNGGTKLTGTKFGSPGSFNNDPTVTYAAAEDGNTATYFDAAAADGQFVGIDTGTSPPPSPPTGLTATPGNAQAALSWTASSGATSYNILRSTVNGSGYASVATGITTTSYTNTGLTNGTAYYFVVTATNANGTSGNSSQASATPAAGGGTLVTSVRFYPRPGLASRMTGGIFQGSANNATWVNLVTVASQPTDNAWTTLTVSTSTHYRYLRFLSPNAGYGNVSEIEFYNGTTKLTGTGFGTPGSFANQGNTFDKALDGNTSTYFDAPDPGNGDFIGIDLGS